MSSMPRKERTWGSPHLAWVSLALVAGLGLALGPIAGCRATPAHAEADPRPVRIDTVHAAPTEPSVRYSANIAPQTQVPMAFKVAGYIATILQRPGADKRPRDVQQGDVVKRGTVLARVSPTDYSARVDQSRAGVVGAQAAVTKARADFDRASRLFETQSLTKPELDTARAALDSAESRLTAAQAETKLAEIALHDTELTAPLDGIVLERRVERGALVAPGAVGFVVGNLRSVKAVFGVPDMIAGQMTLGMPLPIRTDALPNRAFPGRITAVSPAADPQSRVFSIEVTVPNQDDALRPGMVATVEVQHPGASSGGPAGPAGPGAGKFPAVMLAAVIKQPPGGQTAADVPSGASGDSGPGGSRASTRPSEQPGAAAASTGSYAVFVVEDAGGKTFARVRPIVLGDVSGNTVTVTSGLRIGERVIVSGATLVHDGEPVRIVP
jgi:RND family efflux transporter MFP subunit